MCQLPNRLRRRWIGVEEAPPSSVLHRGQGRGDLGRVVMHVLHPFAESTVHLVTTHEEDRDIAMVRSLLNVGDDE